MGIVLIASSLLSLIAGAMIDLKYGNQNSITGNILSKEPPRQTGISFEKYAEGLFFSYSILSLIMGFVFLFGVDNS